MKAVKRKAVGVGENSDVCVLFERTDGSKEGIYLLET